jgi:tetratricopeptide (TPR) repeat protein
MVRIGTLRALYLSTREGEPMGTDPIINSILELWMRCRFQDVVSATATDRIAILSNHQRFRLSVLRAQALYELHRVDEAKSTLHALTTIEPQYSQTFLYAYARLCYVDEDMEKAQRLFLQLMDRSEDTDDYFNACLGLAYTAIGREDLYRAQGYAQEMLQLQEFVSLDKRMSLGLLNAHLAFYLNNDFNLARQHIGEVLRNSAKEGWTYWIIKALYSLATMEKNLGKIASAKTIVDLLGYYLDPTETVFQIYLVNEQFKDQNADIPSSVEFDQNTRKILVNQNRCIDLQDKPIIFNFLFLLHTKAGFVSKQTIARSLWPEAVYKPRIHDPRIFDIVKRTRTIIESYESQPVILLSGRAGYKLAVSSSLPATADATVSFEAPEVAYASTMEGT